MLCEHTGSGGLSGKVAAEADAVSAAQRSQELRRKDCTRRTLDGELPRQSLSALTALELKFEQVPGQVVPTLKEMTPQQQSAFQLLGLRPHPAARLSPPEATSGARRFRGAEMA